LALFCRDHAFVRKVRFVADQDSAHVRRRQTVDLLHPVPNVLERIAVGDVVNKDDPIASAVVRGSDRPETFLACGIPNLEFDGFAFAGDRFDLEIDADRRNVVFTENIVRKPNK
jgi:hypothetical protein